MMRPARLMGAGLTLLLSALVPAFLIGNMTAQIPDQFTNLKVLPQNITKKQLIDTMKGMTFDLGTRCWFCHKGEGDDLSTYEFPSDEKPQKGTARTHIRMTREINENFFPGGDGSAVTCNTCHQGQTKPASKP